jgi:RNA polymerase sigma factor (sigma-70 family)
MWTRDTIEALYRRHAYALFRRCRQLLRDDEGARDAMHEVFVHALRDPAHFAGHSGAATYLYGVATRLCLNRLRNDAARGQAWLARLANHHDVDPPPPGDPVEARQLASALLAETDEESALMAVYHFIDGLSQGEVATLVGRSRVTVNHKLRAFRDGARRRTEEP